MIGNLGERTKGAGGGLKFCHEAILTFLGRLGVVNFSSNQITTLVCKFKL